MTVTEWLRRLFVFPSIRRKHDIARLKNHPIFRDIGSWITVKIGALDIQCPSKRAMAIAYLKIYFEEMESFYLNLCDHYRECDSMQSSGLFRALHSVITKTNERASLECIPSLFIDKMNKRFLKHIDILSQTIEVSSSKKSYSTKFEQVSSILDMSLLFLHMEVDAIETTINDMNGELERALQGTIYDKN